MIIWAHKGGEKYISVIMASETIKIFKIKIAKNIGPSPQSWSDNLNLQNSHFSFISKKFLNIFPCLHLGQQELKMIYLKMDFIFVGWM